MTGPDGISIVLTEINMSSIDKFDMQVTEIVDDGTSDQHPITLTLPALNGSVKMALNKAALDDLRSKIENLTAGKADPGSDTPEMQVTNRPT